MVAYLTPRMYRFILIAFIFLTIGGCADEENLLPERDVSWSFVVFSDPQEGYGIYRMLVDRICSLQPTPAAAFCCGDIMNRAANEVVWLDFLKHSKPITDRMPLFIARGNHDGNDAASDLLLHQMGKIPGTNFYYNCRFQDALFIILDTQARGEEGAILGKQLFWLKEQLVAASSDSSTSSIFLLMHRPLFPQGIHKGYGLTNADSLHLLFTRYQKIRAVFSGHDHTFSRYEKDGVIYITVGSAGGSLRHQYPGDYYSFTKVSFYASSKRVNIKTVGIFNEVVENFDLLSVAGTPSW